MLRVSPDARPHPSPTPTSSRSPSWRGPHHRTSSAGKSLVPLLRHDRPSPDAWRRAVPLERLDPRAQGDGRSPRFFGLRHQRWKYVSYPQSQEEELYDTVRDPFELQSLHGVATAACLDALRAWSRALAACAGQECRDLEQHFPARPARARTQRSARIAPNLVSWSPATVFADPDDASVLLETCVRDVPVEAESRANAEPVRTIDAGDSARR